MKLFGVCLLMVGTLSCTNGYKILVLLPFPGPSHFLMFKVFIKELIDRGHEVTSISAFAFKEQLTNFTEVLIEPPWSIGDHFSQDKIYDLKFNNQFENLIHYWWLGLDSTEHALQTKAVKNFILNDDTKFDLILAEQFYQESLLMFAHKYQAPIVSINTNGFNDFMDRALGMITPYSFAPHFVLNDYDDNMNFLQRCHNLAFSMIDILVREFYYMPAMEKMAKEHFKGIAKHEKPLPSVRDLEKSISVILVNSHFALVKPRPMMPGMINIAGAHIKPVKVLPSDVKNFLDGAENGAIYMSLGSFVQSSSMPRLKMEILLKVFGSLKQRVLWKFETDDLPHLSPNVMVQKWLPQSDVLAHPKLLLFIAHGGLYGTLEASYRGVPTLFIPFYGDQFRNEKLLESHGFAQKMLFTKITEQTLRAKIIEMISNRKYQMKAKEISKLLNDNQVKPIDEAMYWIEYVIRHKGAKHLKSNAVNIPWYKYLMLDVLAAFGVGLWVSYKTIKALIKNLVSNDDSIRNQKKVA